MTILLPAPIILLAVLAMLAVTAWILFVEIPAGERRAAQFDLRALSIEVERDVRKGLLPTDSQRVADLRTLLKTCPPHLEHLTFAGLLATTTSPLPSDEDKYRPGEMTQDQEKRYKAYRTRFIKSFVGVLLLASPSGWVAGALLIVLVIGVAIHLLISKGITHPIRASQQWVENRTSQWLGLAT
jgi:hypothetical protein